MRKLLVALGGLFLCLAANAQNVAIGSLTAQGVDCTTAGACITLQFDSNDPASASIQLSGTFTATVQFEASSDKGTTWVAISGTPLNSSATATSATTANTWKFNVASITNIRARCSAWTSAPTVVIRSSRAVANATGGTSLPAMSDNGTNITSTEALLVPDGTASLPGYAFSSESSTGFFRSGASQLDFVLGGAANARLSTSRFTLPSGILVTWTNGSVNGGTADLFLGRIGSRSVQIGTTNSAAPSANTLTIGESSRGGTDTNIAGSSGTIKPGIGTGLGAGTKLCIQRDIMGATGTTAQSAIDGYCVGPSKTLSNTTATAQSLVNISVPSNSAGGVEGTITVTCTDGTNFDSETQSFNTSYVNKATVLTVTAPVITATSAANNSGSCTAGITAVAGTNSVDIKVTPAFTTIVPTNVTSYITLRNNGIGNPTFN